jgi:hypothetical protein
MKIVYGLFSVGLALTLFAGCNGAGPGASAGRVRDFKSTTEPFGNRHPAKTDINPNGTITCTRAMGKGDTACYVNTPSGGYQVVKQGDSISTGTTAGQLVLTCNGNGALACNITVKD